jgi:Spy/CpxP family protein refolding chaperone
LSHRTAALLVACLLAAPASAQHAGHSGPSAEGHMARVAGPAQPYASLRDRRVKALSEAQEADLRAGRGMALALAAELNGYPGPMHVLEHAEALRLTPVQRAAAEALRARMAAEAQAIGARMLVLEEELDGLFVSGDADTGRLAALTAALGALGGRLRETHLAAHIGMRAALDPGQRETYARLRGYGAAP